MKILIIIVLYNKKIEDLFIFKEALEEETDLFIYDNSPKAQTVPIIHNAHILYEHNKTNPGVSVAYNRGIKRAKELEKDTVLLLDHDTIFTMEYAKLYQIQYMQYRDNYIYAPIISDVDKNKIYSPALLTHFIGKAIPFNNFKFESIYNLSGKSVINSGLMIPLTIFEKIGGFNEKIKLDFSDIYFIEKYKELNIDIILLDIYIEHSISGDEGKNYKAEMHRFKYYCNGAQELSKSLSQSTFLTATRRMLRLVQKYYSIKPIHIYINYYLGNKKI